MCVVNTPATQSVTLTSTGTVPVTISGATLTGAGFTLPGAAFPATLSPGQAATLNIEFDPTAVGAATGQLTIASNSSTNGTAVIGLSGTGTAQGAMTYYVDNCLTVGSDSNNGTSPSTAWLTIAHVNAQHYNPGDSILFQSTCTWREKLIPPSQEVPGTQSLSEPTAPGPRRLSTERIWSRIGLPRAQQATTLPSRRPPH